MAQDVAQIIFVRNSQLLLGFRQNTEVLDQLWGFPSGRIESGELPLQGAKREALEEVSVKPNQLTFLDERSDPKLQIRHYFYVCEHWSGKIKNAEPNLCREVCWFDIESLPKECTPITYLILPRLKKFLVDNELRS